MTVLRLALESRQQELRNVLILCYHELASEETSPWVLRPETFAEQLAILVDRGYRFDDLPRVPDDSRDSDKRVVITFDDGTLGCLRYAHPLLQRYNIRGWFYLCVGYISGTVKPYQGTACMNWAEVRELAAHHEVGAHSLTHCVFDRLPRHRRLEELGGSKVMLEDRLGRPCLDFATPYGYVDEELAALAKAVGFSTLSTTESGMNHPVRPFRLQRWEVHSPGTRAEFEARLQELEAQQ
jgi:peptidoglycan/xylan/chitin deacetylase (PgdA/CDA1 family)